MCNVALLKDYIISSAYKSALIGMEDKNKHSAIVY